MITIHKARKEDVEPIVCLWKEMMAFHAERDGYFQTSEEGHKNFRKFVEESLSKSDFCVLVAEIENRIIGYTLAHITLYPPVFIINDYGEIMDFAITAEFRRRGIGKILLKAMLEWFDSKGVKRVECRVAVKNEISTRFWRAMGFKAAMEILYMENENSG